MSHKQRIERLAFSNFRGATKPVVFEFQPQQPVVLIFGENGSGKSTIADALDFLCNNDFGSIRLRSGTTPRTHIVSAQSKAADLEVQMVYGGQAWQASLQSGKPVTTPAQPPRAFVLRRADITKIMEATDSERYKSLKSFITVPQIENAEETLRSAYKIVSSNVDRAIQQKSVAETTLHNFWEAEGRPGDNYLSWASLAVSRSVTELETQITQDKSLYSALSTAKNAQEARINAASNLQAVLAELANEEQQLQEAEQVHTNADILATLQAAKTYLANHPETNICPVCAKPEPNRMLLAQLDIQLSQLSRIQTLRQQVETKTRLVQQTKGALNVAQQTWRKSYTGLLMLLSGAPVSLLDGVIITPDAENESASQITLQQLVTNLPHLVRQIGTAEKAVNQHNALATHLATLEELQDTIEAQFALSLRLKAMLDIVEEERKRHVQDTVDGISTLVDDLYNRIHPNEPIGQPSFGLKKQFAGSLTLTGRFGGNSHVPPAAYYSEAHLDTLGLCVYLALAKQSGNALVVLDDVLMSVDDPHLDRVIDLINEEASNFGHVIILTHSRAWFDRMRLGQGMQAELIELYGWDLSNGIHHNRAPLAVDELREAVHALRLDRQSVASRAGILLEQMLDDLTLRYNSRLPRKHVPRYTLGEMADGFDKKLRSLLCVEQIDANGAISGTNLFPLIAAATGDSWIRNQVGAHFNPDASRIPDAMVKQFGENVLALADALLCDHCHQLPRNNKSGSYWECGRGCGHIRLYPLSTP